MRKITPSPLAPVGALATISLDTMPLNGSGGSVAFQGGVRRLGNLLGLEISRRLSTYILLREAVLSSPYSCR